MNFIKKKILIFLYPNINFKFLTEFNFFKNNINFLNHHPIIKFFKTRQNKTKKNYVYDFIGAHSHKSYTGKDFLNTKNGSINIDHEYFEWISVLLSVYQSSNSYTFYEVGAGYGRWGVRAFHACQLLKKSNIRINFFEAEPLHHKFLKQHIQLNGLQKKHYKIFKGILSDTIKKYFYVEAPKTFGDSTALNWYGQSTIKDYEKNPKKLDDNYHGHDLYIFPSGWKAIKLNSISFKKIIGKDKLIDLIDFDIQGEEYNLIRNNVNILNVSTKRLHISTHSSEIHKTIKKIMLKNGWLKVYDFDEHSKNKTPFGTLSFEDGLLVFINPRIKQYFG